MNKTMENLLTDWGVAKRQLPENNLALKEKVLNYPTIPVPQSKTSNFKIAWFPLALSSLAVIILILQLGHPYEAPTRAPLPIQSAATQDLSRNLKANDGYNAQKFAAKISMSGSGTAAMEQNSIASGQAENSLSVLPPPSSPGIAVTDNRQFLKTSYSANILSRHVQEIADRIQTTIRGFDGRVDSVSNTTAYGYVSFVVPVSKFDAFKTELKNLAGDKFITESSQSQNMLPEKKSIEDQQKQTQDSINQLMLERDQLTAKHNQTAASLNAQIKSLNSQIASLQTQIDQHPENYQGLYSQQQALINSRTSLQRQLTNENSSYATNLDNLNSQILDNQSALKSLDSQNSDLLDQVATVQGTVYLSHINLWDFINAYIPVYWTLLALIAIGLIAYFAYRRKNRIAIP
jgi:predicted nuclease with TOPRIM domain